MDQAAGSLRELFDLEYAPLVRLATLITGDSAAAEDAVREAFARALARWSRIRGYGRVGSTGDYPLGDASAYSRPARARH